MDLGLERHLDVQPHSFLWPLVHQTVEATIDGLEKGWAFFQGGPKRLILDNFPAAVAGTDPLNPRPTRAFVSTATNVVQYVDEELLRLAFQSLRKQAAPGVDGQSYEDYAAGLDENLWALYRRPKSGRYRAPGDSTRVHPRRRTESFER